MNQFFFVLLCALAWNGHKRLQRQWAPPPSKTRRAARGVSIACGNGKLLLCTRAASAERNQGDRAKPCCALGPVIPRGTSYKVGGVGTSMATKDGGT